MSISFVRSPTSIDIAGATSFSIEMDVPIEDGDLLIATVVTLFAPTAVLDIADTSVDDWVPLGQANYDFEGVTPAGFVQSWAVLDAKAALANANTVTATVEGGTSIEGTIMLALYRGATFALDATGTGTNSGEGASFLGASLTPTKTGPALEFASIISGNGPITGLTISADGAGTQTRNSQQSVLFIADNIVDEADPYQTTGTAPTSAGTGWGIVSATFYSSTNPISGNVVAPLATVSWTGPSSGSVFADDDGNYTTDDLVDGSYTVTPSKDGYVFSPASQIVVLSGAPADMIDFDAMQFVTADAEGNYVIPDLPPNSYLITPQSPGVTFTPTNRSETITDANLTGVDFTAEGGGGGGGSGGGFGDGSFGFGFGF